VNTAKCGLTSTATSTPLLPYSLDADAWTVWQWDKPANREGVVVVLRRPESSVTTMELHLRHLIPDASYQVEIRTTYDRAPVKEMRGSDLAHLQIQLLNAPGSTLVFYRQK
jgi:hypothetical protein